MRRVTKSSDGVSLALVVTPMLDMAFQLLAFFVMTYHPSALEGHVAGNLVPHGRAQVGVGLPNAEQDPEPGLDDPGEVVLVRLQAVKAGQEEHGRRANEPSRLSLQRPHEVVPTLIADAATSWSDALDRLKEQLRKAKLPAKSEIKIVADGEVRHRYVVQVYDACQAAGFQRLSFAAPGRSK